MDSHIDGAQQYIKHSTNSIMNEKSLHFCSDRIFQTQLNVLVSSVLINIP